MNQYFSASSSNGHVQIQMSVARIDGSISDALKADFRGLPVQDAGDIVVDMQSVDFIDSSGLGALVSLRKNAKEACKVRLVNTTPFVNKVVKLTKLDRVFGA